MQEPIKFDGLLINVKVAKGEHELWLPQKCVACSQYKVPDPDLEIRGRGGGRSSGPLGKGEGGTVSQKFFFGLSGLSLVQK